MTRPNPGTEFDSRPADSRPARTPAAVIRSRTPWMLALIGFALFLPAGLITGWWLTESAGRSAAGIAEDGSDPTLASPDWGPEEVVRQQLASLRQVDTDPDALRRCFSLASPANRRTTGPLERFGELLREPTYVALLGHRTALVGDAVKWKGGVTVLATLIDRDGQPHAFRFFLSRQVSPPHRDCWMTEAVMPMPSVSGGDASKRSTSEIQHAFESRSVRRPPGPRSVRRPPGPRSAATSILILSVS